MKKPLILLLALCLLTAGLAGCQAGSDAPDADATEWLQSAWVKSKTA